MITYTPSNTKKIRDLIPGDMFDAVPVLEKLGIEPDPLLYHGVLYEVEEVWEEQPGVMVVCSTEGGNYALPSDEKVAIVPKL